MNFVRLVVAARFAQGGNIDSILWARANTGTNRYNVVPGPVDEDDVVSAILFGEPVYALIPSAGALVPQLRVKIGANGAEQLVLDHETLKLSDLESF